MSVALDPSAAKGSGWGPRDPWTLGFLVAAIALAGLRFSALGRWSLWLDEAFTLADARQSAAFSNPLGYLVFNRFYGFVEGRPDEFWLRFPAAVFGLVSVLATAWAFWPVLGRRAAALAALFLAASVWHLYWSQNARFYTLAQSLALIGGGALLRGLLGPSTLKMLCGLLFLVSAALVHPSAALLAGPLVLVPWIARWLEWIPSTVTDSRAWRVLAFTVIAAVLCGSGWALQVWFTWNNRQSEASPGHLLLTTGYLVTPTLGLAFLVGLARGWRRPGNFAVVAATLCALSVAGVMSFFLRVSAQYVFVALPWIAAVAALSFPPLEAGQGLASRALRWQLGGIALVVLPGLAETGLYFGLRHGDRPRWREAYQYVYEHVGPEDLVLGMDAPVAQYYLRPDVKNLRNWTEVTWLDEHRAQLVSDWLHYGRRMWLVINREQMDDWSARNRETVGRILEQECRVAARFEVPLTPRDLDVVVYVTAAP